eukprot:EG_transcript_9298
MSAIGKRPQTLRFRAPHRLRSRVEDYAPSMGDRAIPSSASGYFLSPATGGSPFSLPSTPSAGARRKQPAKAVHFHLPAQVMELRDPPAEAAPLPNTLPASAAPAAPAPGRPRRATALPASDQTQLQRELLASP